MTLTIDQLKQHMQDPKCHLLERILLSDLIPELEARDRQITELHGKLGDALGRAEFRNDQIAELRASIEFQAQAHSKLVSDYEERLQHFGDLRQQTARECAEIADKAANERPGSWDCCFRDGASGVAVLIRDKFGIGD